GVDISFKRIINVQLHLEGIVKQKRPVPVPQFASGGGWATEIIIHNPTNTVMTGRVQVFSAAGTAVPAVLNGIEATAFEYRIEAGENTTFSSRRLASL